jgi:eukaryotic-like serine/threonine-protein kinase
VSTLDRPTFEQCALASGLLTQQQLDEARAGVRWSEGDEPDPNVPPSDRQLADRLVEMGLLNAWQAKQLLDGRTKFNLGPYLIVDSIGQGGMGQVFKAQHEKIGRIVAVKVLPRDKSTPEAIASFTREIRALASLDHPRLVSALDAGQDGNVHYLVTEYVPGTDLRKLVRRDGPLSALVAASIISQVAEGLEYAHAQGLIHRDVKPGNVLVSPEGVAKLSDLGLAGSLGGEAEADPRHGKIVGTADYISPDHVRDPWNPTPAWDIYSLGCTLYYAVTGKVPFPGGTTADKARAHCELRPLDPRRLNPRLGLEFVEVMADMMAKEPAQRIPTAREVITRLAPFLTEVTPIIAPPPIVSQRPIAPLMANMPSTVPPPLKAGQRSTPLGALADTKTDIPGLPTVATDEDSSSSEVVETYGIIRVGNGDAGPPPEIRLSARDSLMAVLWPFTIFVLAPLALVGAVGLLWFVLRAVL